MENDIVRKIREAFASGVGSEQTVVYILVELRKLMEQRGDLDKFPTLRLYCNWVVHPRLDNPDAQRIVQFFDRFERLLHEGTLDSSGQIQPPDRELVQELHETLELTKFQRELTEYLSSRVLGEVPFETWGSWIAFLVPYLGVVQDCPLRCVGKGLTFVDEVVARAVCQETNFVVEWRWKSKLTGELRHSTLTLPPALDDFQSNEF